MNNKNIFCPRCMNDITTIGQAINTRPSETGQQGIGLVGHEIITHKNLELINVFKCPKCGHSENIDIRKTL